MEKVLWLIKCVKSGLQFHARDFSLDDAPQLSRPVEVGSDQIETVIEKNERYTMLEIADILKISKSIVIGVNEKCVFIFQKENTWNFWLT